MAYSIEEQKRAIEDFLAGRVAPADIEIEPGPLFHAEFIQDLRTARVSAKIAYDPLRFDEAQRSEFALVDGMLVMQIRTQRMQGRDDLRYVLDGVQRQGATVYQRRLYAARAPDGRLVVRQTADAVRDMTRRPKPRDDEPVEFDPHAPVERTPEDDVDDAAIAPGF